MVSAPWGGYQCRVRSCQVEVDLWNERYHVATTIALIQKIQSSTSTRTEGDGNGNGDDGTEVRGVTMSGDPVLDMVFFELPTDLCKYIITFVF